MKNEFCINPGIEHYSCMIDLFAKAGCLKEAIDLIDEIPFQSDATMCSAVLRGCIENGEKSLFESCQENYRARSSKFRCSCIVIGCNGVYWRLEGICISETVNERDENSKKSRKKLVQYLRKKTSEYFLMVFVLFPGRCRIVGRGIQ